jgi:hypothetical protein
MEIMDKNDIKSDVKSFINLMDLDELLLYCIGRKKKKY